MKCEFKFCIYQLENKCTLSEISVDALGVCESCILIEIDEVSLQGMKNEILERPHLRGC